VSQKSRKASKLHFIFLVFVAWFLNQSTLVCISHLR